MKVAILTPTFSHFSGIDRVVQSQAEELVKKGHKVTIVTLKSKIKSKNYKVIQLGMPKNLFWQRLYRLFFFLDRKKMSNYKLLRGYDTIISHFYPMNLLASKAKKEFKIKYVYWDHGINVKGFDTLPQKMYMHVFRFFSNMSLKNVDRAFSVSKYLSEVLLKESGIKSKVVYNKINRKKYNKSTTPGNITKKYGLKDKKVFFYIGRISPHKGIHLLIRAFQEVKKEIPNAVLLIGGKPTFKEYYSKLRSMAGEGIIFTGFVDDKELPHYYAACDVYATGSQWEGFNLPAVEAQACGKPVVAFKIGSHPEVIKKGILVKNKDITAFADAMRKLVS